MTNHNGITPDTDEAASYPDTETAPIPEDQDRSVLPGFAPERVAADPSTVTDQLVKSLTPVGAYRTDDHRYYFNGIGPYPSVTTVLGILDKPAVVTWKAKEAARALYRYVTDPLQGLDGLGTEEQAILWALAEADKQRDTAAALGSSVHLLADIVGASEKGLEGFEVSDREIPYVEAFRGFLERYSASSIVSSEKMVWSANGYAGTYDLMMHLPVQGISERGQEYLELWLIDIKTSKGFYPEYGLQLAGYRWADQIILPGDPRVYPMPTIHRTGVLHLRPDAYPDTGWRLIEYPTDYQQDYLPFLGALEVYQWKQKRRFTKSNLTISKP